MNQIAPKLSEALKSITSDNLKLIYEILLSIKEKYIYCNNESIYNEVIQATVDFLIYAEKENKYVVFEYIPLLTSYRTFCELNFMSEFLHMFLDSNNRHIVLHIIKGFALLILTLTDKRSLYYFFSHECFKQILNSCFEDYGDDFLSYYVNFIKSLALKIDMTTITFFFYPKLNKFPLLESTLRLYNYPDAMIRNVVRNIFLTLLRLNNDLIFGYLSTLPSVMYFPFIACRLRDLTKGLNKTISTTKQSYDNINHNGNGNDNEDVYYNTKCILDDMIDDILYLQDIFSLKIIQINTILINSLLYYWIIPIIYRGLLQCNTKSISSIDFNLALYILALLFYYIKDEQMLNVLFIVFFYPEVNTSLSAAIQHCACVNPPKNYHFDWTEQLKGYTDSTFQSHIIYYYSKEYIRSLIKKPYLPFDQITPIVEKYEVHPLYHKKSADEQYEYIIEDVFKFFSEEDVNEMKMYHRSVSLATGVNVGIKDNNDSDEAQESFMSMIKRLVDGTIMDKGQEEKYEDNEMKDVLMNTFNSKEFPQSFIGNLLLYTIMNSKVIGQGLFGYCLNNTLALDSSLPMDKTKDTITSNNTASIQFNNDYLNSLFQSKAKHQPQQLKDSQPSTNTNANLLSNLIHHFVTQNYLHSISNLVIISNILSVHSFITTSTNTNQTPSSAKDRDIINRTYYIFLSNIKLTLITNEDIKQRAYPLFESAWFDYRKGMSDIIKTQMTLPNLLLPQDQFTITSKLTDLESFKGILSIFVALHDMRQITLSLSSSELLLNKFPFCNANLDYGTGSSINLLESQIESFECSIKKNGSMTYSKIVLILYLNYMYIGKGDAEDEYSAVIEEKYPLRQISSLRDYLNAKELFIDVKDDRGYLIEQMKIQVNDDKLCTRAFDKIEEYAAYAKVNERQLFVDYIMKLISDWELIK